jgi:hypothetical protein
MNKPMLFADTIDPVLRANESELFLIRIEVVPDESNPESAEVGGAFANALVDADSLKEAEEKAIARIEAEGWKPQRFDYWEMVCKDCYSAESQAKEEGRDILSSIETAFQFGVGLIFHTWPIEETEEADEGDSTEQAASQGFGPKSGPHL